MNLLVVSLVLIVYPLFGFSIYLIRNRLSKMTEFNTLIFVPVGVSFVAGIIMLAYALSVM